MISVIIVDYNSMDLTVKYIEHFVDKIDDLDKINFIIVDNTVNQSNFNKINNSKFKEFKHHFDYIKFDKEQNIQEFKWYKYKEFNVICIKSNSNLGFAKANNLGALISRDLLKDKYYIFSNNDLSINKRFSINDLLKPFKLPNVAVVGPRVVGIDNLPQSPRKKINIWKQLIFYYINLAFFARLNKFISNKDFETKDKYTYWVIGCFFIVDSEIFHQVGMFDKNTFLYAEEMILAERLLKQNYYNYFVNNIELTHLHGGTTKNVFNFIKNNEISFSSNYYYFKEYIKSSTLELFLAKLSFNIFKSIYPIKSIIKRKCLIFSCKFRRKDE